MEPIAKFDFGVWEARFPFAEKTSDPLAKSFDHAHELFVEAIQIAKTGNFLLAGDYVAAAFLHDLGDGALIFERKMNDRTMPVEILFRIVDTAKMQLEQPPSLGILSLIKIARGWSDQYETAAK